MFELCNYEKGRFMNKCLAIIKLCRLNKPFLAIPFAGTAAFLATEGVPDLLRLVLLLCAAVAGFMAGNAFNGITDRKLDASNPRTKNRPLVTGELSVKEAYLILVVCFIVVIVCTGFIDVFLILLLPIPLTLCLVYSLSKRYTWCCHFILATVNAVCPVGGWLVFGRDFFDVRAILCGGVVFCWTVGFELIYSSQDIKYDIEQKMHSIPSVFGIKKAYIISALSHGAMLGLFVALIVLADCGLVFTVISAAAYLIIIAEHIMVSKYSMKNAALTFDMNQVYSLIIFGAAILDTFCYIPMN